jgi:tetratricopeptide (TPR) repeat protein
MAENGASESDGGTPAMPSYRYNLDGLDEYLTTAEQIIKDGRYNEAVAMLREAVQRYPDSATAHFQYGSAQFFRLQQDLAHLELWESLADDEEAAEECFDAFQEAIRLDPTLTEAYVRLGSLLALRGRPRKAIEVWEKALKLNPELPGIREDIEECRARLGEQD